MKRIKENRDMFGSIRSLAKKLQDERTRRRTWRAVAQTERNPHLARDVGLPYRPDPMPRTDQW